MEYLSIGLDIASKRVIATFIPQGDVKTISADDLANFIHKKNLGGYDINQPALHDAAEKYNSSTAFEMVVAEARDGKFSIRIDDSQMVAYLSCSLPLGGEPVQKQSILDTAKNMGITEAIDLSNVELALLQGANDIPIAKGRKPVRGEDGKLEPLIHNINEKSPRVDEQGLSNFRELGKVIIVHPNDRLIRLIPPTNGIPGVTVTGKILPAQPGKPASFAKDLEGVAPHHSEPDVLVAQITGLPVILNNGVEVRPVYSVANVDLTTGNIVFSGSVHVSGDVLAGMSIKATGDIHIEGTVELSNLEAGGDITVKGGVIGNTKSLGSKAFIPIKCGGAFSARFVQHARVSAGTGIFIHDFAMLSELKAGHQIVVGSTASRDGDIIGGSVTATMLVKARNFGAPSNIKTTVSVGNTEQSTNARLSNILQARGELEQKLTGITKLLEMARASPNQISPKSSQSLIAMDHAIRSEIECLRAEEIELRKQISLTQRAHVIATKGVFSGTEIKIGSKQFHVNADMDSVDFHINEIGKLVSN